MNLCDFIRQFMQIIMTGKCLMIPVHIYNDNQIIIAVDIYLLGKVTKQYVSVVFF